VEFAARQGWFDKLAGIHTAVAAAALVAAVPTPGHHNGHGRHPARHGYRGRSAHKHQSHYSKPRYNKSRFQMPQTESPDSVASPVTYKPIDINATPTEKAQTLQAGYDAADYSNESNMSAAFPYANSNEEITQRTLENIAQYKAAEAETS